MAEIKPEWRIIVKQKIDQLMDDPICQKWITYNASEEKNQPFQWFKEKQKFWEENRNHLISNGFEYSSGIGSAIDQVELMKKDNIEGSLLIFKVGSNEYPADPDDIQMAYKMVSDTLSDVKGVRVMVTHHAFDVTQISLPQLRALQSSVLSSTVVEDDVNSIMALQL